MSDDCLVDRAAAMIAISRFRVSVGQQQQFRDQALAAIAVLSTRPGCRSVDFGRNLDEPELWTISSRWENVGSYRRALQGFEAKTVVVPLLSLAIDEPSAYEDPDLT